VLTDVTDVLGAVACLNWNNGLAPAVLVTGAAFVGVEVPASAFFSTTRAAEAGTVLADVTGDATEAGLNWNRGLAPAALAGTAATVEIDALASGFSATGLELLTEVAGLVAPILNWSRGFAAVAAIEVDTLVSGFFSARGVDNVCTVVAEVTAGVVAG
jgi:hypothetical protein